MEIFIFILILLILAAAIFFAILEFYVVVVGDLKGAPFVPSPDEKVSRMLELAELKPGETVTDLGSGNGKILIAAAGLGCRGVGLEINPFLVWYSRWKIKKLGLENKITILRKDFYDYDLSQTDVVFVYLLPKALKKLKNKMSAELKKDARIISNTFPIPDWTPIRQSEKVFIYKI